MPGDHEHRMLRQRLRQAIRGYRSLAGMSQRDVARAMDWSLSKVNRIESGTVAVSTNDLRALLTYFGIADAGTVNELVTLAKVSKRPSWCEDRDNAGSIEAAYLAHEASASVIRQYEPALVPGLLQTREYMRAVFAEARLEEGDRLERLVEARLQRQQVLDRAEPPALFFILDEAVLRRQVGDPGTMPQQLEQLAQLGARKNISIQIVPFARGAYVGLLGPFVVLEDADHDSVLYLEAHAEPLIKDDAEVISRYFDHFQQLERKLATDPDHLRTAIASLTS
jgi:transcriptional regulator with XRE-family HTH domain